MRAWGRGCMGRGYTLGPLILIYTQSILNLCFSLIILVPSFTCQTADRYKMTQKSVQPPHIFAIADSAYQAMLGIGGASPKSQCCVIRSENFFMTFSEIIINF